MTKTNHPRRIAREAVLQALYAYEITKEDRSKVLKDIINRDSYDNDMQIFITTLFNSSIDNKQWCEEQIIKDKIIFPGLSAITIRYIK